MIDQIFTHTHTTLFTKAWQIQNIDISDRRDKYIYIYIYIYILLARVFRADIVGD